jgi:virginiamycin B lyase
MVNFLFFKQLLTHACLNIASVPIFLNIAPMIKATFSLLLLTIFFSCMNQQQDATVQAPSSIELKKIPIEDSADFTIHVSGFPDFLITDGEDVWVSNIGRLDKLTTASDTPVASVSMPFPCGAGVNAFGSLWVANCGSQSIYRIDKTSLSTLAIINTSLADPFGELSLAAGAGSVWVLTKSTGVLSRIDPSLNAITNSITVKPNSYAAAFGFDAVWVSNTGTGFNEMGSVQRIDPVTNKVVATIPTGLAPHFIAAGEGGVWVLNQGDGNVVRIDPATNKVAAKISIRAFGPGGDIATGAGRVWIRSKKAFLVEIDAATNKVLNTYMPPQGSGAVRVTDNDLVWASAHDVHTVWAIQK